MSAAPTTLPDAIREAKESAGLDPERDFLPSMFVHMMHPEWVRAFWERQVERALAGEVHADDPSGPERLTA